MTELVQFHQNKLWLFDRFRYCNGLTITFDGKEIISIRMLENIKNSYNKLTNEVE